MPRRDRRKAELETKFKQMYRAVTRNPFFVAAVSMGIKGRMVGPGITEDQPEGLRKVVDFPRMKFIQSRIEELPLRNAILDCIISNGVISPAPD